MTRKRNEDEDIVQPRLFPTGASGQAEQLEIISHLPESSQWEEIRQLYVPNYQPDRAIREAVLAEVEDWQRTDQTMIYSASNQLLVYLGTKQNPLLVEDALKTIGQFSGSTVLTARIALALWHQRRHEQRLAKNGAAAVRLDEILFLRGLKKRSIPVFPGSNSDQAYTIGYRQEDKQATLTDLAILQQCIVRGECTVNVRGKWQSITVDDEYLRHTIVYKNTKRGREIAGLFISAGDWINVYEDHLSVFLAAVEREVFQLDPHDEQHELRLALYLTERWREQSRHQNYREPISMQELLHASVIPVDKKHAYRFIPRIDDALEQLYLKGILGARAHCINPADRTKPRWTKDWLASKWVLIPPTNLQEKYLEAPVSTVPALPGPRFHTQKTTLYGRSRGKTNPDQG